MLSSASDPAIWPGFFYGACVAALLALIVGLSHVLGQRGGKRDAAEPYESGIASTGSARLRISVRYYLLAMFFLIFDLEIVFLVTWSVALRELGWRGYASALVFMVVLGLALAYLWRSGALEWRRGAAESGSERRP
jgi:NADH-quinone oxidoreductase subunit A